jgi:hypothetical protein
VEPGWIRVIASVKEEPNAISTFEIDEEAFKAWAATGLGGGIQPTILSSLKEGRGVRIVLDNEDWLDLHVWVGRNPKHAECMD